MASLADEIERYLKELLGTARDGRIEVRRWELADRFACVPSQINYVLETRFSPDCGYVVESRRGGGGFIRITRVRCSAEEVFRRAFRQVGSSVGQGEAERLLALLEAAEILSPRQAAGIRAVLRRETAWAPAALRGRLRAGLLRGMLLVLLQEG